MQLIITGDTLDELQADFKNSLSLFALGTTHFTPPPVPAEPTVPAGTPAAVTPGMPSEPAATTKPKGRKRRTKQELDWDKAHGVNLKMRKKMEAIRDQNPHDTDEQLLARAKGEPVPGASVVAPVVQVAPPAAAAPPVPAAPPIPQTAPAGNSQAGPALIGNPPVATPPPAPTAPPSSPPAQAPDVAQTAPVVEPLPPTPPAGHGPAVHANPAPGAVISDDMLRNAFGNLASNVGNEAAADLLTRLEVTQVADIPMEYRAWCVSEIDTLVRAQT